MKNYPTTILDYVDPKEHEETVKAIAKNLRRVWDLENYRDPFKTPAVKPVVHDTKHNSKDLPFAGGGYFSNSRNEAERTSNHRGL